MNIKVTITIFICLLLLMVPCYSQGLKIGVNSYGDDVLLTIEERAYLDSLKEIDICVDPNWMPYEAIEKGKYIGLLSDYIELISKRLDIPFVLIPTKTYKESREFLDLNRCHLIVADVATDEVKEKYLTTKPYFFSPRVFALNSRHSKVDSFDELLYGIIGVQEQSPAAYLLKMKYPDINIKKYPSTDIGLQKLEANEIVAFVTIVGSISYSIQKQSLSSVKIGGEVLNDISLSMLINKSHPQLVPILNKSILTISSRDRVEISENWITIKNEGITDYSLFLKVITGILVLLGFTIYHLQSTKRLNTLLMAKNIELQDVSRTDPLTGIMNRRAVISIIKNDAHKNLRSGLTSCLLLFDIDHFKSINDIYGHDIGDLALKRITESVKVKIRNVDFFARWGGEEFLILASGTSLYNANILGEKIRSTIESLEYDNGMKTTVSIGIAEFTNNEDLEEWFKRVDEALYRAKDRGRNRIELDNLVSEHRTDTINPFSQVTWKIEYASGNIKIDSEHRQLFEQVSILTSRLLGKDDLHLVEELTQLINDTKNHFDHEEEILKGTKYPGYDDHVKEHEKLISRALKLLSMYENHEVNETEILSFCIFDLIAKHLLEYDTDYFKYLD